MGNPAAPDNREAPFPSETIARRGLAEAVIVTATFIAYAATLGFGFTFDDHVLIDQNDSLRAWRFFPGYFAHELWYFRYPHMLTNVYRPLLLVWLRLNFAAFGLHPRGWHLTIVIAHVAVAWLVYRLALRLTRQPLTSAAAALFFGLHPVHVETVAEAAWADQPLSALFTLAALLTWWRSREPGRRAEWTAVSLVMCAASLLSKESGMVIPLLVSGLAAVYYVEFATPALPPEGRRPWVRRLKHALMAGLPYWAVVCAYVPLRIWALKKFSYTVTPMPLSQALLTIPSVLAFYLRLLIWPVNLSCYYNTPYITTLSGRGFLLPLALVAAAGTTLALWYRHTRRTAGREARAIAYAGLWMILTVGPVLNFRYFVLGEVAHDRYLYLPSVGFAIMAAIALRQALAALPGVFARPAGERIAAAALFVLMGGATLYQSLFWSDDLTVSYHACQIAPHNAAAITNLASALGREGKENEAMAMYREALAIQPNLWRANLNLAYLYYMRGNYSAAGEYFSRACAADPSDGDQFVYLGMSLLQLGRPKDAEVAVRLGLEALPQGKNYHLGLGMVLKAEGRLAEAQQAIETELALDPANAQAQEWLRAVEQEIRTGQGNPGEILPPSASPQPLK